MSIAMGITIDLAVRPTLSASITASISGLTTNPTFGATAQIGTTLTAAISEGTISSRKWGSTLGGSEFGTGVNPTDFTSANGGLLHLEVIADGITYQTSATVRYAPPVASGGLADLSLTVDVAMTPVDVSADFTGDDITITLTTGTLPTGTSFSDPNYSGTPTVVADEVNLVFTGTNSGGSATTAFGTEIVVASGPDLTASITAGDIDITSTEEGTVYYGIYPTGTLVGAVTIADMITGTDTAQIDDGTAGIFVAAGTLADVTIDESALTGGTDYEIFFVVDIDDGGTYTNLATVSFTAAVAGPPFVFGAGSTSNTTIAASVTATVATISLTGSGVVAGDIAAVVFGSIASNAEDFGLAPDDILVNDVSTLNQNHAVGSDTPSTNRAATSFATHVVSAGDITADELVIKVDTPSAASGDILRYGVYLAVYRDGQFDQFTSYMAGDLTEPFSNSITLAANSKAIQAFTFNADDSVPFDFENGSTSMDVASDNVIVSDNGVHVQYDTTTVRAAGSFTATANDNVANTPHGTTFQSGFGASIKPL